MNKSTIKKIAAMADKLIALKDELELVSIEEFEDAKSEALNSIEDAAGWLNGMVPGDES